MARVRLLTRPGLMFCAAAVLGLAACAPAPEVIVLAPTHTLAGPVVPTRAPAETLAASPSPSDTPANTPEAATPGVETATKTAVVVTTAAPTETMVPPTPTATPEPSTDTPVPPPTATASLTPPPVPTATLTPEPVILPSVVSAVLESAPAGTLNSQSVVTSAIGNLNPYIVYALEGEAGSALDFKLETTEGGLRPMLIVVDANGVELARSVPPAQGGQALLRGIPLAGGERLIITRVNGRDGRTRGTFELTVSPGDPSIQVGTFATPITYGGIANGTLDSSTGDQIFTFTGHAGDIITLQAVALSGDLDTQLMLNDLVHTPLARNDDDPRNDTLDSAIYQFPLQEDGPYTIALTRFNGTDNAGDFRLKLTLEGTSDASAPLMAQLDHFNSVSLTDGNELVSDFRVGDIVLADGEVRVQTLLTFHLPPLPAGSTPAEARLVLNSCTEYGGGFADLGDLSLLEDPFGEIGARRDYSRPATGSRTITTVNSCADIDLSTTVAAAYAGGRETLQLRLAFEAANVDQQSEGIRFDPRLLISPGA